MNASATPPALAAPTAADRAARQAEVVAALRPLLPAHALLWHGEDTVPYECDGLTAYRQMPLVVTLPETETQVAAVLKACHALQVPVVAYVLCLASMAAQAAVLWRRGTPRGALLAVGGALFMLSDALLAFNKFAAALPMASLWILATYWLAQACIAGWLAPRSQR